MIKHFTCLLRIAAGWRFMTKIVRTTNTTTRTRSKSKSRCAVVGCVLCIAVVPSTSAQIGPDIIVKLEEFAHNGRVGPIGKGVIGAAIGTTGCNAGDEPANWFELPNIDHPVFPSNFYRLMTVEGSTRFEQIGQSWIKHGFGTEDLDECGFGCTPPPAPFGGIKLGIGCSDTYTSGQAMVACDLSPRSAFNPYTGVMAGGDNLGSGAGCSGFSVNYPSRDHRGHVHNAISHTNQIHEEDLLSSLNPEARYFAEAQYIVPHEFVDGNGNQSNNVVYREYRVVGPNADGLYFFPPVGESVPQEPAMNAWPGSTISMIEPAPLIDGRAFLAYQTTDLGAGIWHYEYTLYNMNLDRALASLSIPVGSGATLSNVSFHAPLNQPHVTHADNYSNNPWDVSIAGGAISWATDSFVDNYLANAVTWGTLYNYRFDANAPPQAVSATVGLFKTGDTITVATVGPSAVGAVDCNSNGIDDACDLSCDPPDCAIPGCGQSADCTGNGIPDECEADCQGNGTADRCELASGTSEDCNKNGVPDECDPGGLSDCNANQNNDICDIATGVSEDFNHNGLPDECDPHLGVIHVDDNAPGDPTPGDPSSSDPLEDGSIAHPFDAIQEAVDVALIGDVVLVADGLYTGAGNFNINFGGRTITVRSENGAGSCTIDIEFQGSGFIFDHNETEKARVDGFTIIQAVLSTPGGRFDIPHAGVKCEGGSPSISNCDIKLCGGRPIIVDRSSTRIVNCTIHDNAQPVLLVEAEAQIENCTLANIPFSPLLVFRTNLTVTNSIIRTQSAQDAAIFVFDPPSSVVDVTYSDVEGGWPGVGNVDVDPLFVDEVGGDFRLTSTSPGIDAGTTSGVCALTDLLGGPRFLNDPDTVDTGVTVSGAPVVDMGAIEFVPADCNNNGTADDLDISGGGSTDTNGNGIPDECEHDFDDCNGNSLPDICEPDCNGNGVADECDITGPTSNDCNGNGIPDECEAGWDQDCDGTGTTDLCAIADGTSQDCNGNGIPDECDVVASPLIDCNLNGIPDECDIRNQTVEDCNANGRPDACDLSARAIADCNENGVPDLCETIPDCNANGVLDSCDLDNGNAPDVNGNGIPDECDIESPLLAPPPHDILKNRYISIDPRGASGLNAGLPFDIRVTLSNTLVNGVTAVGQSWWANAPDANCISIVGPTQPAAPRNWDACPTLHLTGCPIMPTSSYDIVAILGNTVSDPPLAGETQAKPAPKWFGDVVGTFTGTEWEAPNGVVSIDDANAGIKTFQNPSSTPGCPTPPCNATHTSVTDVEPNRPDLLPPGNQINKVVNIADVLSIIIGFQGVEYPGGQIELCPDP